MRNIRRYLILAVIILIIAGYAVFYYLSNKTQWNDTYVNGNTAGNLYNNGLFCERDGMVYFSNPNDSHYLYSMDLQTGETEKLYEDIASFINADDRYVYYVRIPSATSFPSNIFMTIFLSLYRHFIQPVKSLRTPRNSSGNGPFFSAWYADKTDLPVWHPSGSVRVP